MSLRTPTLPRSEMWPVAGIALLGLVTAGFCFGILKSKAQVGVGYSAGGAFAGAVIAWSALGALYLQLQRSSTFVTDLLRENQSLQNKVLRGAPRPNGFESEVDERLRLVFARPGGWQPGGGLIFDFQCPFEPGTSDDIFPARFQVSTEPIDPAELQSEEDTQAAHYRLLENEARTAGHLPATEIVYVGAESDEVKSLRTTLRTYARAALVRDPNKARPILFFEYVTEDIFQNYVRRCVSSALDNVRREQSEKGSEQRATGLESMSADSKVIDETCASVVTALENGTLRPSETTGLEGAVEAQLRQAYGLSGNQSEGTQVRDRQAIEGFTNVRLSESNGTTSQSARKGAGEVTAQSPTLTVWEEVLPIIRTTVVCYHKDLKQIYYFDFVDNPSDYVKSSESFTQILKSVRFLN